MMGYSFIEIYRKGFTSHIDEANHRCPFPIGWLMKKEGFEGFTPLTTGLFDDRWD